MGRVPSAVIIGLDVGTTGTKAVAFNVDGGFRHGTQRSYALTEPKPGWQVQDPHAVVEAAFSAVAECVSSCHPSEVVAVSMSAAMHGLIGVDGTLWPITALLTFADGRASEVSREIHASGVAEALHEATGTPVHPMSPMTKIRWFGLHDPVTSEKVRFWLGLKDWILYAFTGELVTERSTASGSGLMDRWSGDWSDAALDAARMDRSLLPSILPTTHILPMSASAASRVGLPASTPVVLGAGDGPLANVGCGAVDAGVAGLSLGTSGAIRVVVSQQPRRLDPSLFCYALDERTWTIGGAVSNGGIVLNWLADLFAVQSSPDTSETLRLLDLAEAVAPGSDGLTMLPYLLPERAPLWDPDIPGALLGLRRQHGQPHVVRAGLEGVAMQLAAVAALLSTVSPITSIRATGGVFQSRLWASIVAACLGRDLIVSEATGGSALGAAALGLTAFDPSLTTGEAAARLSDPHASDVVVSAKPEWVTAYAHAQARIPLLIEELVRAGRAWPVAASADVRSSQPTGQHASKGCS